MHINFTTRTIKYCMLNKDTKLSLDVNNEEVYRVILGGVEVINTLSRDKAESKYNYHRLSGEIE